VRVLVVEDEEEIASAFRDLLLEAGHAPVIVPSVDAALARFEAAPPDAILLNLYFYFPGVNGLDFLRRRPDPWAAVPLIAVSGFPTEGQARECLRLGVLDFVDKRSSHDLVRQIIAYLEVRATGHRQGAEERRRSPRPTVAIPIQVTAAAGSECQGECVDLSLFGMRARLPEPVDLDSVVKLSFVPPGEAAILEVLAVPVRGDAEDQCFRFVGLSEATFRRLDGVVRREADRQSASGGEPTEVGPAGAEAPGPPAKDRVRGRVERTPSRAQ
jgi:CheY-like chemotaxis protein